MSAISANSAVFARKALAGAKVASKRTAVKSSAAFSVSANAKVDACDKNSVIVSPSILSADFATLGAEVRPAPRERSRSPRSSHRSPRADFRARAPASPAIANRRFPPPPRAAIG